MELANLWQWEKRKLPCKIRPETGNPSGDALRERLAELAGVNLQDLLNDMKNDKKRKEAKSKVSIDHSTTKTYNDLLGRFHIIGASEIALGKMNEPESAGTVSKKNINKMYLSVPKSPPKRVLMDIQRERAKPLRLPDSSEEKNLATMKLEKKLAKQRAARMAAKDEAAKETEIQKKAVVMFTGNRNMKSVLRKYEGDRFSTGGEYMEGMLYLSRMPSAPKKPSSKAESQAVVKNDSNKALPQNANGDDESEAAFFELYNAKNSPDDEASSKLYCATALCNWARNASNAPRLANEGAVRAIMQLSNEKVARISVFCAGAFRYMSEHQILAEKMIEDKAINSISEMISSNNDDFICGNLAICLLNLTRLHGREGQLVEDSIVLCFMNIISQRPELLSACCRGLYNLTCVDASYPMMERVIRCLVSLSSNASTHVKHICAAALCNLGDLKGIRLRMVEEGVISVLGTLARGSETKTRRVCAVILQNLAATRACRTEMVSRNCVQVAYGLSSDQDPIILRCIGLCLSRLALESQNSNRIISDGGVLALCNIAVKYPTIPGISQPVAVAFQLLSSRQAVRVLIVQEGSVAAIAALLRLSGDVFTLQHGMLALCNLLSSPENHLPIVQQGLVSTLILLSSHENENLKDFCALAYFNLSCAEDSRKHIVNAGAIISIIKLSEHDSCLTKRRCAATLCNIAAYETGMYRMVQDGIIPALVKLLVADDIETVRYSCAAICRLSSTVENGRLILESGAVPNVVQGAMEGDTVTKQFCCAVLSALTFYEGCREALCDMGIIAALQELADLGDDTTKQRCLVAYANLSCADSIQRLMVESGVVKIIARLADSYQETNQKCCALALCNLASQTDSKLQVIKEGGVQALMMISMVRSVEISTKLLCVRALSNLLEASTVKFLIDEGIVGALANLCNLASENIVYLCAQLFNQLSYYEEGRAKIIAKSSAVKALFNMFHTSPNKATKVIVARTTCNLVLNAQVRTSAIENGALDVLTKGIQLDDSAASMHCIMACFYSSLDPNFRVRMVQSTVTQSLGVVALEGNPSKLMLCAKTLCALAWAKESRAPLQNAQFASVIMKLVNKTENLETRVWITQILYFISLNYKDYAELLELGMLLTLRKLCTVPNPIIMRCIAAILRCFCVNEYCINILANVETIYILKQVAATCDDKESRYNITVALNAFANNSSDARHRIAVPETIELLYELGQSKEVIAATLCLFSADLRCRTAFANNTIAELTVKMIDLNPREDVLANIAFVIYSLSKIPASRDMLLGVDADRLLLKLSNKDNANLRANCSRALKNLTSEASETIEEGAVASLIAMSLEGKTGVRGGEEIEEPTIIPMNNQQTGQPKSADNSPFEGGIDHEPWVIQVEIAKGDSAGRGPPPPEPPAMQTENSVDHPSVVEELDSGEAEGKTKMAFAKMQIPFELRDSYLFDDRDFEVREDDASDASSVTNGGAVEDDESSFASIPATPSDVQSMESSYHTSEKPHNRRGSKKSTKKKSTSSKSVADQSTRSNLSTTL